jgi:hypothetical protein
LIKNPGFDPVEFSQILVQHDFLPANQINCLLNSFHRNNELAVHDLLCQKIKPHLFLRNGVYSDL